MTYKKGSLKAESTTGERWAFTNTFDHNLKRASTSTRMHTCWWKLECCKEKIKKLNLLKTQIKIRKKVLGQKIHITFSHSRRQQPIFQIVQELSNYIDKNTSKSLKFIQNPGSLVGRDVSHKFKVDETGEIRWYHGTVIGWSCHQITSDWIWRRRGTLLFWSYPGSA